ncbi:MAG: hypothetical protein GQ582_13110 [Methyloprofundus sp.]|nr:hypothetical protein [Methyloprofundus sp.]
MRKIILTVILSSFLPALAVAESKTMQNTHKTTPDVMAQGKHMMNTKQISQSEINMKKKHMSMGDNPFSSHEKKAAKKANKHKGYSVVKYKK